MMNKLLKLFCMAGLLMMASCSNVNSNLEKMIPGDATGAVCVRMPEILEASGILSHGDVVMPRSLQTVIDSHDEGLMSVLFTDLPYLGLDLEHNLYAFSWTKTFNSVLLVPLSDAKATRKTMGHRLEEDFKDVDGLSCIYKNDELYAIDGDVLLVGRVAKPVEVEKAVKSARSVLLKSYTSLLENDDVRACLHDDDTQINAYITLKGLKSLLNRSELYQELSEVMPLVEIFTESDIDNIELKAKIDEKEVNWTASIHAADNSEYMQLLNTTLSKPSADVLKAIPNSMDYIISISIKGDRFVELNQIKQLLDLVGKQPKLGALDLSSILTTVDGPFAVGLARDPMLEGEWNLVISATSRNPDQVMKQISAFANKMGQAPEMYDNEYVYEYENKMIRIGQIDGVLYVKLLDYEQTEGNANSLPKVHDVFAKSVIGLFAQTQLGQNKGYFDFGFTDNLNAVGHFYTDAADANVALEFLRAICVMQKSGGNQDFDASDMTLDGEDDVPLFPEDADLKLKSVS